MKRLLVLALVSLFFLEFSAFAVSSALSIEARATTLKIGKNFYGYSYLAAMGRKIEYLKLIEPSGRLLSELRMKALSPQYWLSPADETLLREMELLEKDGGVTSLIYDVLRSDLVNNSSPQFGLLKLNGEAEYTIESVWMVMEEIAKLKQSPVSSEAFAYEEMVREIANPNYMSSLESSLRLTYHGLMQDLEIPALIRDVMKTFFMEKPKPLAFGDRCQLFIGAVLGWN